MNNPSTKDQERSRMRSMLQDAAPQELLAKSAIIRERFLQLPQVQKQKAGRVHVYCSFKQEVDTLALIQILLNEGRAVFCPKIATSTELSSHPIRSMSDLQTSKLGFLEPVTPESPEQDYDLIVVPGLAFDGQGFRLGRGQGYYDRFLKNNTGFRLALAYEFQIRKNLPATGHDQCMNGVLTEARFMAISHCA